MFDFSNESPISTSAVAITVPSRAASSVADQSPVRMSTKSRCVMPGILNCGSSFRSCGSIPSSEALPRVEEGLLTYPTLPLCCLEAMRGVRSVAIVPGPFEVLVSAVEIFFLLTNEVLTPMPMSTSLASISSSRFCDAGQSVLVGYTPSLSNHSLVSLFVEVSCDRFSSPK